MSDIDDFGAWIVKNQALKGTPDFETVAKAFKELDAAQNPVAPVQPKERTWGGATTDIGASLGVGAGNLIQLPGQLYGLATGNFDDSGILGLGKSLVKSSEAMKSEGLKQREALRAQKIAEADKQGVVEGFKTAFGSTVTDIPLLLSFIAEQAPQLLVPFGAGKAGSAISMGKEIATGVARKEAASEAGEAGVKAAIGAAGVQQGADVGAQSYEDIYKYLVTQGTPPEDAKQQALDLARATGAAGTVISILAQKLPGARVLEEALVGVPMVKKTVAGIPLTGITGRAANIGKAALGETGSEMVEEGGGKFTQNLAMRDVNPNQSLTEGVGSTAGLAAVGGVGMGGVSGALQKVAPSTTVPESFTPTHTNSSGVPFMYVEGNKYVDEYGNEVERPASAMKPIDIEKFKEPVVPVSDDETQKLVDDFNRTEEERAAKPVATPVAAPATTPVVEPKAAVETPQAEVFTVEDPVAKSGINQSFSTVEEAQAHADTLTSNRNALVDEHQATIDNTTASIDTLKQGLDTEVAKGNYGTPQFLTHENNINTEIGKLSNTLVQEQAEIARLEQPIQVVGTNTPTAKVAPVPAPLEGVTEPVYTPELAAKIKQLRKSLLPTLERFGLKDVGLNIVASIENGTANAHYVEQVMQIAYNADDPMGALRHESIHALKELGAFTENEWRVLSQKAKDTWVNQFISAKNQAKYKAEYLKYKKTMDGFDAYLQEEAIAEAFRHFANTKPPAGLIGQLYSRLNNMFQSLGNSFKQLGYTNAEDIFQKIERGEAKPKKVEKVAEKAEKIAEKPEAHTGTMETNTLLNKQGKEANEEYDNIKDIDKPWAKELVKRFENIQRKVFTSLSAGTINRLASTVVGEKVRVGKTDTQAFGTFDGKASPNMRIPMSYMTEDNVEHNFTKEQAELMLVVLGTNLNQEAQAASLFTPVETGADTFRIRLDNKILNERDAAAFDKAIGYPVNVYQDENGHGIIDINLAGNDPFTSEEALKSAMGKVFPNAEYTFTPCKYESIYITSEKSDYSDKSYKEIVNEWKKGESTGGTRNGLWETFDVDFKPSVTEIRNLATARNKEFKEFAQEARRRQEIEKKVVEPEVKAPVKVKKSELESLWNSYRHTALPFSSLSKEDVQVLARVKDKDGEVIDRAVQKIYKGIDKAPTEAEVEAVAAQEIDTKEVAQEEEEVQPEEEEEPQAPKIDKAAIKAQKALDKAAAKAQKVLDKAEAKIEAKALKLRIKEAVKQAKRDIDNSELGQALERVKDENFDMDDKKDIRSFYKKLVKHEILEEDGDTQEYLSDRESDVSSVLYAIENELQDAYDNALQNRIDEVTEEAEYQTDEAPVANQSNPQSVAESLLTTEDTALLEQIDVTPEEIADKAMEILGQAKNVQNVRANAWAKQFGDLAAQVQALLRRIMNGMMSVVVGINLSVAPPAIQPHTSIYTYTTPIHVANFKGAEHTEGVQRLANAILDSKKNDNMAFVIADKASATMYVFDENGNLRGSSPVLLGATKGDKNAKLNISEIGGNPLFKITPSGIFTTKALKDTRYKNEFGYEWIVDLVETTAEDRSSVAIHAVYVHTPSEHRQARLDTKSIEDNRVSWGCLNAPLKFMQDVVKPTFEKENGKVFITPEEMGSDAMLGLPAAKTKTVKKLTQSLETESGRLQTSKQEDILAAEAPRGRFQFKEDEAPLAKKVTFTEKFKRWFGNSEIVNKDGTPKVMYHGTARDITTFTPKEADAIFLTDSPDFAASFTEMSEEDMIDEAKKLFPDAEWKKLTDKATAISKKDIGTSYEYELRELIRDTLPSNANIMPVYVSAKNVFDYENAAHVDALQVDSTVLKAGIYIDWKGIKNGSWVTIESAEVQAAIKKAGFDGFYVKEGGRKNLAVYTSNQIKSAIGNNGEFDINNPDIRYQLRTPVTDAPPKELTKLTPAQTLGRQIKDASAEVQTAWHSNDFWTNLRQTWVDPSSALAQSLSGKGAWDLKGLRADMLHRAKSQIINVINNGLQIGTAKLNKDGSIIIERSDNNLARSQILADKLDANPFVQATGLSGRKFVSEIARRLRGEEIIADDTKRKAQAVKDLAEARKMFKDSKDLPYKEKAKVRREAANLRKQAIENKNINRELQVTPEDIAWAKKQLANVPEVEEVFDIWRNVNNSLLDLWHDTGLLKKTQVDEYRSKKRYVPMFASKEDLNEQMFGALGFSGAKSVKEIQRLRGSELDRNIWENMYKNYATKISAAYENQTRRVAVQQLVEVGAAEILTTNTDKANLRFKDYNHPDADANGVVHALVYNTNDVLAFQNMHYELTPLMKGFSKMTNILRTGALLNPMFWIRQLIRDPIHASIVTDSGIVTPFHAAKEFINILKNDSREFSILFERGVIGPRDSTLDYHDYLTQIGQEKSDTSTFRNALHKIEMMHEASDAATRVSIFKDAEAKALKHGMSKEDAINYAVYKSRESINFSVHGNGKMLNTMRHAIPFFSASITSLDTVYRAATGYGLPPAEKAAAQKMFKQRAGAMLVMSAVYAMMMQGDDEYKRLPDHVKDGNWLVPNPLGTGFIKIAVPFEVGFLFKTIPETAVRYMAGTSTGKEVLASYQAGIIQNMPGNLVPVPQAVRPLLEAYTNYSFFTGETIETAGDSHLPTAFRGANASELSKVLSKFGLDSIGLSPTKIDYLMQGFMAELGITGMALASQAVLAAEGKTSPDTNLEKLPFFKAFMTDPNADKAVSDFYKIEQNAVEVHTQFQKMLKSGMGKEAIEYLKEGNNQKIIAYEPSLIKMSKQLGTIRAAINITTNNQSMSPEDRRLQINNLKKVYNNVADAYAKVAKSID